ncbi:MAG: 4-aminobutyrate--2-oxoglutarate transaminase [Alphaproteobacteria bacterium]|nr:4-aminobutyrate--2-oxoglutarate transaminase [Alphaproteobacteria bacterium]MBU4039966.1 4-aminobutyrate--2-oxoglutarate transaminase [Alphaproteobacteria bacterium]MBU4136225.1 4-aminobutyrate--2-oxoglutarate transaminase [Alphaproteobacteria bacterium]
MSTNADLHARRLAAVPRGVATATQIFAARAENAELWDVEGRRYVDFAGGIAVLNTGHRHPRVLEAVRAQLDAYTHTAFQVVAYEPYVELAERLNALAPFDGPAKTIFFTTGAEAVENAVKMARAATGRSAVIAFTGGFHGRTLLTMAMTGKVVPYKRLFGPLPGEVFHAPFPVPQYGVTVEDSLRALEFLFRADVEPERVAAIIIEPVQGEGGFQPAPPELLRALREICDRHGILLISDEVQAGFARTGKMFGIEHSGVQPDMITVAKSLAGGFPLSGVIGRAAVMDAAEPGGLGGTYAGPPIACAAALAVLDVIVDEQLMARADAQGERIKGRLQAMSRRNDLVPIAGIRGPGAMVGFDIVRERGGGEPDGAEAKAVTVRALQKGLLLLSCGVHGETIRLLAPLTTPDAILDEGLDILEASLERLS